MCLVLVMIPEVVYIFVAGDRSVLELHCRFWNNRYIFYFSEWCNDGTFLYPGVEALLEF